MDYNALRCCQGSVILRNMPQGNIRTAPTAGSLYIVCIYPMHLLMP